jgi:transcriptional regulator with XRE-family HTH domain
MEFNKKLQELRKQKGLTQEELAQALYVSRTAISKWESGRGYPNIESLKAIAAFFSVTVDTLLSSDEILTLAEEDGKKKGAKEIIGVLHYPPTNDKHQVSGFTELMTEYGVKTCVYGHLHGKEKFKRGLQGVLNGVEYKLVSLDYLDARPMRLK